MTRKTVWHLPRKSQEFDQGPRVSQLLGDRFAIAYDFETASGAYEWEEILFEGVASFRYTASRHCSVDQIDAYDQLQVISGSGWAEDMPNSPPGLRHYRIYFDDVGCYDVLAAGFIPPPVAT